MNLPPSALTPVCQKHLDLSVHDAEKVAFNMVVQAAFSDPVPDKSDMRALSEMWKLWIAFSEASMRLSDEAKALLIDHADRFPVLSSGDLRHELLDFRKMLEERALHLPETTRAILWVEPARKAWAERYGGTPASRDTRVESAFCLFLQDVLGAMRINVKARTALGAFKMHQKTG